MTSSARQWVAPGELVGVPGLPTTVRNVRARAVAENWRWRERQGRGGGREYLISDLPPSARAELARRALVNNDNNEDKYSSSIQVAASAHLTDRQEARAAARLAVLRAFSRFLDHSLLPDQTGAAAFSHTYNAGQPVVEAWVKAAVPHFSAKTLLRWRKEAGKKGAEALAGRYGRHRIGTGVIDRNEDMRDFIVGMLASMPHVDAAQIMRGLRARFATDDGNRELPAYRSVQRWVARWKEDNSGAFMAITNPDAHRSRRGVAFGSASEGVTALNQLWELDTTPQDIITADGRRNAIIGVIDVYSRRFMLLVSPTSSALAVTAALRRAILAWGVPERVKTDNGSDYVSFHVARALAALRIEQTLCPPGTPQDKPHIERALGTMSHQFMELLPGYVGHSVADRKDIEARRSFAQRRESARPAEVRMTAAELQAALDRWSADVYERQPHKGIGATPFEKAAAWPHRVRRVDDERALDVLLAEAPQGDGHRVVAKTGIRVEGATFISGELGAYVGERVMVRLDPADQGAIYVFAAGSGAFICKALCPERTGISRQAAAAAAKKAQNEALSAQRKTLRAAANKIKPGQVAEEILRQGRAAADVVVALPRAADTHDTPALAGAAEAARLDAGRAPEPAPLTDSERESRARVVEALRQPAQPRKSDVAERRETFDRCQEILADFGAGEPVDPEALSWAQSYRKSNAYRAEKRFREGFGLGVQAV